MVDLTNDELEFRNLRLKIENFELDKLLKLRRREYILLRVLQQVEKEIKAQKLVCDDVKTNYQLSDFEI
jgi:hypothetical protein